MQIMVVPLEDYNDAMSYAPQWAKDKWNLEQPRMMLLTWVPHWWPWGKSHGTWRSKLQVKRHD